MIFRAAAAGTGQDIAPRPDRRRRRAALATALLLGLVSQPAAAEETAATASAETATASAETLPPVAARPRLQSALPASFAPLVDVIRGSVVGLSGTSRRNVVETIHATGIVVSATGHILTTDRMIRRGRDWRVRLPDGTERMSRLLGRDPRGDLALLGIDPPQTLTPIVLGSSEAYRPGDWLVAYGGGRGDAPALVKGTFSGHERERGRTGTRNLIVEMVVAGFGGSPLIDMHGRLVGVVSGRSGAGSGGNAVGYAIPVEAVRAALGTLEGRRVGRASWLGVRLSPLGDTLAETPSEPRPRQGALVNEVIADSPAERAAILPGDLILEFNGQTIASPSALSSMVRSTPPKSEVDLVVMREAARLELHATLEAVPRESEEREEESASFPGITYGAITRELAARLGLPADLEGVVISDITPGSRAWQVGLQLGDVVREVNGKPARSERDLRASLRGGRALLLVQRGDSAYYVVLDPEP